MIDIFKKFRMYGFRKSIKYSFDELMRFFYYGLILNSYSQHQEDLIIDKLLWFPDNGFYVDVWAYEPNRLSNTKRFYEKWRNGINIEPNPTKVIQFSNLRKRDINLSVGVSTELGILQYYDFFPSTLWTFSEKDKDMYVEKWFQLINTLEVSVKKLSQILEEYSNGKIDFMSVDVEWYDLEVLKSNDRVLYRPRVVCIEILTADETGRQDNRIVDYMLDQWYEIAYHNWLNVFFRDL